MSIMQYNGTQFSEGATAQGDVLSPANRAEINGGILGSQNSALLADLRRTERSIRPAAPIAPQHNAALPGIARAKQVDLAAPLPADAILVLSALEAAATDFTEKRSAPRMRFRRRAALRLFADAALAEPLILYTRDASERGLSFICAHRAPLGYGGVVELLAPDGQQVSIACTIYRCCQTHGDWFSGCLYFNREQPTFAAAKDEGVNSTGGWRVM